MDMQLALVVYVAITLIGLFISQRQRKNKVQKQSLQWKSIVRDFTAIISAFATAIAMGFALLEAALRENDILTFTQIILGTVIMIIGWAIAYLANREIGANWSPVVEKTERQELVTSGIYSLVRHPLYLSGLLILAGTNLYFSNKWAWIGFIIVFITVLFRIPVEERELVERYGDEYILYKQKTKAIIPWVF